MRSEPQPRHTSPSPPIRDGRPGAGLYGEVAALPINRIVPQPVGERRTFL